MSLPLGNETTAYVRSPPGGAAVSSTAPVAAAVSELDDEELLAFVKEQSQALQEGEKVPASTEVLESCFGTLKSLEKDQSRSGFTGLALGLGALVGNLTKQEAGRLLRSTPAKAVRRWCKENVGQSLQRKRRLVYRLVGVTDLV